ncbi:sulfite exporter TauE/SafE family protein [Rhodococcus sp. D2-41]|uniref:sulfite exporter TauE/SafE family protein n=1 Tax=Speluncibacter jeojiensis TaxID=2710754 RepID=UPI00240EBD07|nr:sulfite exporter TauE/SafE family protein [Rhodococcus sp. D2-41]MDG3009431.1 sulfite exporter TauE/SafE family protein [Rhodococcus sp. D2-41]
MVNLLIFALVGAGAQLVGGVLGMAFGVTATTLLMLSGVGPAHASATVHLAEIGTSLASGIAHWRFRTIDCGLVLKLGVPGAIGAVLGAGALSRLSTESAIPVTATALIAVGIYVLLKSSLRPAEARTPSGSSHSVALLTPLGLFGGLLDATGGGGWGPVATSTLLSCGKVDPRTVVGSVNTSKFLVAVSASAGFMLNQGRGFWNNLPVAIGLSVGGVIAAPIAAWLVSRVSTVTLGTVAGGVIIATNAQKLFAVYCVPAAIAGFAYALIVCVSAALLSVAWRRSRPRVAVPERARDVEVLHK